MNYNSKNWPGWIYERFGDTNRYIIEIDKEDRRICTIRSVDKSVKSEICFLIMDIEDDDILYDIQFSGNEQLLTNTWCSPFTIDSEYETKSKERDNTQGLILTSLFCNKSFIDRLEKEWLYIPLKQGWTEEVYYVGEKIYKAKLWIGVKNNKKWDISENVSNRLNLLDYLKIIFQVDLRKERFIFNAIEK